MINAVYHRKFHSLSVSGHAYSGDPGHDLVCAAASILTYTLAASVANMSAEKQVRDSKIQINPGMAEVSCKTAHKYEAIVTLIFDTVCAGFDLMARDYPDNINYEVRG